MKVNDSGKIFINQGWRPARCLAVHGDRALIEYDMPAGSCPILEVGAELPLERGQNAWHEKDHYGHYQPMQGFRTARNIQPKRAPKRWREALRSYV